METTNPVQPRFSLLYVEDDSEARSLIERALSLKFRDLRLLSAESGLAGLKLYQEHQPDIILTDIKMPEMDGITMASKIREIDGQAVICVLSAYCDAELFRQRAEELDIVEFLAKPVDYRALFATIDRCIQALVERFC